MVYHFEVPLANIATGETPLHVSYEGDHHDILVELILELITKLPDLLIMKDKLLYRGWYPIHTACAFGASDVISGILFLNKERSKDDMTHVNLIDALHGIATKCGNLSHINVMTDASIFNGLQ